MAPSSLLLMPSLVAADRPHGKMERPFCPQRDVKRPTPVVLEGRLKGWALAEKETRAKV